MRRSLLFIALFFGLFATSAPAAGATPIPDCANPQSAADSLFVFQRPESFDPKKAATCMDVPAEMDGARAAVQLKQILDARGLWVPVSSMPYDPDYEDETGRHRLVPMPQFPDLVYVRLDDGRWVYSRDTVEQIPGWYRDTFSPLSQWFQSALPGVFYNRLFGLFGWQYLYGLLLLSVSWLAGYFVHFLLRTQVRRAVARAGVTLDERTYAKTYRPVMALAMSLVILWGLSDLQLAIKLSALLHGIGWLVAGFSGVLAASRFVDVAARFAQDKAASTESKLDDQVIPLIRQATQVLLWAVGILFILQNYGVDVFSLVAGLGIGGLAFALAAKDTVANLFGSLNIFLDKPFQIGDAVMIGSVEGVVVEVGFRSTRIKTFYNSVITVPNSSITNANVDNFGLRDRRRVKTTLGVTYDTPPAKLQAFVEGVRAVLANHPRVADGYEVHFNDFGASSLNIMVNYHVICDTWTEELETRSANFMEILRLAEEMGVAFAFPSTSVYVEGTPEHPYDAEHPQSPEELWQIAAAFGPGGTLAQPAGPRVDPSWSSAAVASRRQSADTSD